MTDTPTIGRTRSGGRAGRIQTRAEHAGDAHAPAFLRRQIPVYELLGEEGLALIETNADRILADVGIEIRGDEVALGLFRDAGATVDGDRVRFDPGHVRALCATAPSQFTQLARNPARSVRDRRRRHRLRPGLRLALRARPAQRPPLRLAGGLRGLREAGLRDAVAAPLGRHGVRARRRPRQQAPPGHGVRAPALQRQGDDGLGHPAQPGRGLHRDGPHRVRGGRRRAQLRHPRQRQRQLAARVGRGDDRARCGPTRPPTRRRSSCPSSSAGPWVPSPWPAPSRRPTPRRWSAWRSAS